MMGKYTIYSTAQNSWETHHFFIVLRKWELGAAIYWNIHLNAACKATLMSFNTAWTVIALRSFQE